MASLNFKYTVLSSLFGYLSTLCILVNFTFLFGAFSVPDKSINVVFVILPWVSCLNFGRRTATVTAIVRQRNPESRWAIGTGTILQVLFGMGSAARLKAIANALASKPTSDVSSPAATFPDLQPPASSQRLMAIEQASTARVRPGPLTCVTNVPTRRAASLTPSQSGHSQRLKHIQEALESAISDIRTELPWRWTSNSPNLKRPSSSGPEAEPRAKRLKPVSFSQPTIGHGSSKHESLPPPIAVAAPTHLSKNYSEPQLLSNKVRKLCVISDQTHTAGF